MCHIDVDDHGFSVGNDFKLVIWEHAIDPSSFQVHLECEIGTVVLIFAKNFFPRPRTQTVYPILDASKLFDLGLECHILSGCVTTWKYDDEKADFPLL